MAYNKIIVNDEVKIDLTQDTVTSSDVKSGVTFHTKSGDVEVGTLSTPTGTIRINSNGTYGVTDYADAIVQVSAGTFKAKEITANGEYYASDDNVSGYSKVTVNVESSGGASILEYTYGITSNGTYNASDITFMGKNYDGFSSVNVNVQPNVLIWQKYITENGEYISVDEGYDGYQHIVVNIPDKPDKLQWKCDNVKSLEREFRNYDGTSLDGALVGLDTSKVTNMTYMFYGCNNLITIPPLDLRNMTSNNSMFNNCTNLTNLTLKNISGLASLIIGSGTTWGHLLSLDSLVNTIQELWTYSLTSSTDKGPLLTMGTANTAKLANVYVKLIDVTNEMRAEDPYIDNKKPFEICESTDEGAMLITDYIGTKNWRYA